MEHADFLSAEEGLSAATLAALSIFYEEDTEAMLLETVAAEAGRVAGKFEGVCGVTEDFGMSQFWYDEATANALASEALKTPGRLAFVSCPTAFHALKKLAPNRKDVFCFEFDRRFGELYGEEYIFYDVHRPDDLPQHLQNTFDFVMCDPPYINAEMPNLIGQTMRLLAKDVGETGVVRTNCMYLTGKVLEEVILQELQMSPAEFEVVHGSKIGNAFSCFMNYASEGMGHSGGHSGYAGLIRSASSPAGVVRAKGAERSREESREQLHGLM